MAPPPPAPPRREERPHLPLPLSETNPISLPLHPVPQLTGCMQGAISSQRLLHRLSRVLLTAMGPAWQLPAVAGKLPQRKARVQACCVAFRRLTGQEVGVWKEPGPSEVPLQRAGVGDIREAANSPCSQRGHEGGRAGVGQNKALEGKESSQLLRVVVRPVSTGRVLLSAGT